MKPTNVLATTLLAVASLLMFTLLVSATLLPIVKQGASCPSGYYTSGNYCVPTSSVSRPAIPKTGSSCPPGYTTSGGSCLSNK